MAQGKSAISKKKPPKSQGGVKKKQGRTKKGLKKQVKPKKTDQIISKGVRTSHYIASQRNVKWPQKRLKIYF